MASYLLIILELLQAGTGGVSQVCCGEIRGTVVDPNRQPFRGVAVHALDPTGRDLLSVLSAADGSYRLRDLPASRYRLKIVRGGILPMEIRDVEVEKNGVTVLAAVAGQVAPIEADCRHRRPEYYRPRAGAAGEGAVGGVVASRSGRPIEGAMVTLNLRGKGQVAIQRTSKDGGFSIGGIGVGPGEYWLSITHAEYFQEEVEKLQFQPGLEAVYDPIAMEACGVSRCQPHFRALPVCTGP